MACRSNIVFLIYCCARATICVPWTRRHGVEPVRLFASSLENACPISWYPSLALAAAAAGPTTIFDVVHLPDKHLHGDVNGARLLESILEPPSRVMQQHLCDRNLLVRLSFARCYQITHLGLLGDGRGGRWLVPYPRHMLPSGGRFLDPVKGTSATEALVRLAGDLL
jgi:hypothetical protein